MASEVQSWEAGHRCFTSDGREATFVAKTDGGGFVVHTVVETYDHEGDTIYADGPMVVVSEIFRKAPVEKLASDVATLHAEFEALAKQRDEVRREVITLSAQKVAETKSLQAALEEARQIDALRSIIDLANGKFQFAVQEYDNAPYAAIAEREDRYAWHNERVATLEQSSNGKLKLSLYRWKYSSSSYRSDSILAMALYETREEAQAEVVRIMARKQRCPNWLTAAEKLGVEITDADRIAAHEYEKSGAARSVEYAQQQLTKAELEFRDVEAKAPALERPTTPGMGGGL